jgi:hypothetical protein
MLMVILGAGASHDFEMGRRGGLRWRAPLTDGLVEESPSTTTLLNEIPGQAASGLVATLRRERRKTGGDSLEKSLDKLVGTASTRELLGFRMFVQDYMERVSTLGVEEVGTVTNHALLVRSIESWRAAQGGSEQVAYVTFNYDTLLDQALSGVYGWSPIDSGEDRGLQGYLRGDPRFLLFKLHGSSDWAEITFEQTTDALPLDRDTTGQVKGRLLQLANRGAVATTGAIRMGSDRAWRFEWAQTTSDGQFYTIPAISLPLGIKSAFGCPGGHVQFFDRVWPKVDRILTIGWKAAEPHFLERLKLSPHNVRLEVVTRSITTKGEVAARLSASGARSSDSISGKAQSEDWAFTAFLEEGGLETFLARPAP